MPLTPLKVDLQLAHCRRLILQASIRLEESQSQSLRDAVVAATHESEWPWLFFETYRVEGRAYLIHAWIRPSKQKSGLYSVELEFSSDRGHKHSAAPRVKELAPFLRSPQNPQRTSCTAQFEYADKAGTSAISLPISLADVAGDGKLEVRGLRVALPDDDEGLQYSVIVDRPTNAEYVHTVHFHCTARLAIETASQCLQRASSLSARFFTVAEKED